MRRKGSELILNADRSIYHLNLHPEDISDTIITVGDPDRVPLVSNFFDSVEMRKGKREFITHTGYLNKRRLTVISTGIGTDNIDIVLNELDALANIDLETGSVHPIRKQLSFIRLGTSGALQPEIALDSILLSECALGLDGLLHFYRATSTSDTDFQNAFASHMKWASVKALPYFAKADTELSGQLAPDIGGNGFTATNAGFYGPQGRTLRLIPRDADLMEKLASFEYRGLKVTNMEMETAGLYGLAQLLGHRAVSLSCILANRVTGGFSKNPGRAVERLIAHALDKLTPS
jgi:uridine phosphorylase